MKQGMRFFFQPGTFFNQLQWSRHHGWILFSFLLIAAIETHVGRQHALLDVYANFISSQFGISHDIAIWFAVSAKLFFLLAGAIAVAHAIWLIGNLFGEKNSKRVLFRRLSIVFTVMLAAYTASHLQNLYPWMATASTFLYVWGSLLGYIAIREQFTLTMPETVVVGTMAALLVFGTWTSSNQAVETLAKNHMTEVAMKAKGADVIHKY